MFPVVSYTGFMPVDFDTGSVCVPCGALCWLTLIQVMWVFSPVVSYTSWLMSVNFDTGFSLWEVTLAGLCRPSLILFPVGYYSRWLMPVDFDTGYVGFFFFSYTSCMA